MKKLRFRSNRSSSSFPWCSNVSRNREEFLRFFSGIISFANNLTPDSLAALCGLQRLIVSLELGDHLAK